MSSRGSWRDLPSFISATEKYLSNPPTIYLSDHNNQQPLRIMKITVLLCRYPIIASCIVLRLTSTSAFVNIIKRTGYIISDVMSTSKPLYHQPVDALRVTSKNTQVTPSHNSTATIQHKRQRVPILSYKNNYVIVSKPAGISIHRSANTWGHAAKSTSLEKMIRKQLARKPYLVHRLDHRTSGAVIMGFDSQTAGQLHGRLREQDAVKLYVALARGDLREHFLNANVTTEGGDRLDDILPNVIQSGNKYGAITIDLPIKVDDIEKDAKTDFYFLSSIDLNEVLASRDEQQSTDEIYTNKALTLLLCRPRTGRTHQIRKHLRDGLNSPIIGDSQHGDSRVNRFWRETIGLDRLALHCWYLDLPTFGNNALNDSEHRSKDNMPIQCFAPLPRDLTCALEHELLNELWSEALQSEPRLDLEPYDEKGGTFGRNYRSRQQL